MQRVRVGFARCSCNGVEERSFTKECGRIIVDGRACVKNGRLKSQVVLLN